MTARLDPPVVAGGLVVAALCRSGVRRVPGGVVLGAKTPLAVLVRQGGEIAAFGASGAAMPLDRVERLCPGAVAHFADLADAAGG